MKRLALSAVLLLAACGREEVNPPTEPARAVEPPPDAAPPDPALDRPRPGTGPASFVGRWAADVAWCPNTSGERQPITITPTRFEGYENSCAIDRLDEQASSYLADLTCTAEGMTTQERVRMTVDGQRMALSWLSRNDLRVELTKCTTLADPA